MRVLFKTFVGAAAAGAMAASSIVPAIAQPQRHDRERHDGIDAGDVIAGALIVGGIAALASAANSRDRDERYRRWGTPRQAVEQCVAAAERRAARRSWAGRADVTDIRGVRETRRGYEVRGRIAVNTMGREWHRGDERYGRGWNGDYRGWRDDLRGYDSGSFVCRYERGRVVGVEYRGIRGL